MNLKILYISVNIIHALTLFALAYIIFHICEFIIPDNLYFLRFIVIISVITGIYLLARFTNGCFFRHWKKYVKYKMGEGGKPRKFLVSPAYKLYRRFKIQF